MFAPEPLLEVSLFVFEHDLEAVTDAVLRAATLHLEEVESETWAPRADWADRARQASDLVRRADALLEALALPAAAGPPDDAVRPARELDDLAAHLALAEARMADWRERYVRHQGEVEALRLARTQLALLRPLDAPVDTLRELRHQHLVVGTMPAENLGRVSEALFAIAFVLLPVEVRAGRALVVAACTHEDAAVLDRALHSALFEPAPLPEDAVGPPTEALATLERHVVEAQARGEALAAERQRLAEASRDELRTLHARLRAAQEACDAMRRFPSRGDVYLIAGWVPSRALEPLSRRVRAAASSPVVLEAVPPGRLRHGIPTLLRTPGWLRPFALLVRTFGLSGYRELDPTAAAAVTFLFMYGMMFGDLGHGLLLATAGALWAWRSRSPLAQVVVAAGLSGAVFGVLYGTAFGAPLFHPLWIRPLESIFALLLASIVAGVIVLNLGFVLNLVTRARARDWAGLLLDKSGVLGLALYWTLLGGGVLVALGRVPVTLVALPALVLAALLWLREPLVARLEGERPPPLGETLVTGFFELFETVLGFASNSLSFVRLGAFAVAHEGLSGMVLRYAGGSGGWLVVLFGTALIVGFEGLVVGIQALRLEYFEFFGRFFRGDGTPFVPLAFQGGQDVRLVPQT